jgi:hypothetical protein
MPLPPPTVSRQDLHLRVIEMRGYAREDGLYDIEGRVVDRKPFDYAITVGPTVAAGQPIHEMWVRLTIDDDFVVRDAVAASDATPYPECRDAAPSLKTMVGARIMGGGWTRAVRERLGGAKSCTHLMEILIPMGTAAYQALFGALRSRPVGRDASGRPLQIDSCHALASERRVVSIRWPEHYTGPRPAAKPAGE